MLEIPPQPTKNESITFHLAAKFTRNSCFLRYSAVRQVFMKKYYFKSQFQFKLYVKMDTLYSVLLDLFLCMCMHVCAW